MGACKSFEISILSLLKQEIRHSRDHSLEIFDLLQFGRWKR
ncbi:hypothetical protein FOMG_19554 [Fusarium oxysporum f. sp. melonis 26406]|uniref:Uncharacterized protein n=1 Tax=Fusarium oxysporum f. sp. melonis 26406 TaxID=1089452 RepID=W9Z5Z0_FUSOX|nr:hypothetical protein FOMG_19554 [Fusarium oxysporum f. sp. melonis 26406]